jgi:hypothetical protein
MFMTILYFIALLLKYKIVKLRKNRLSKTPETFKYAKHFWKLSLNTFETLRLRKMSVLTYNKFFIVSRKKTLRENIKSK